MLIKVFMYSYNKKSWKMKKKGTVNKKGINYRQLFILKSSVHCTIDTIKSHLQIVFVYHVYI